MKTVPQKPGFISTIMPWCMFAMMMVNYAAAYDKHNLFALVLAFVFTYLSVHFLADWITSTANWLDYVHSRHDPGYVRQPARYTSERP